MAGATAHLDNPGAVFSLFLQLTSSAWGGPNLFRGDLDRFGSILGEFCLKLKLLNVTGSVPATPEENPGRNIQIPAPL